MSTLMPYLLATGSAAGPSARSTACSLLHLLGRGVGPVVAGYIYDLRGSYTAAWLMNLALLVAVPFLVLALKPGHVHPGKGNGEV
jgi:cyanate permease